MKLNIPDCDSFSTRHPLQPKLRYPSKFRHQQRQHRPRDAASISLASGAAKYPWQAPIGYGPVGSLMVGTGARVLYPLTLTWWQTVAVPSAAIAWVSFITFVVFRSANSYQRKRPSRYWGRIAQAVISLGAILSIVSWLPFFPGVNDGQLLAEQLGRERKLVGQISNGLREDWVTLEGRSLDFGYTAVTQQSADTISGLGQSMQPLSARVVCANPEVRHLLYHAEALHYTYQDTSGKTLSSFAIRSADCDTAN